MDRFEINPKYVGSCTVQWYKIVNGHQNGMTGTVDHPSFAALRNMLGNKGYIEIERGWWNGDRVLIPFQLNDLVFKEGDKFCSGGAMSFDLERAKKEKEKQFDEELFNV